MNGRDMMKAMSNPRSGGSVPSRTPRNRPQANGKSHGGSSVSLGIKKK